MTLKINFTGPRHDMPPQSRLQNQTYQTHFNYFNSQIYVFGYSHIIYNFAVYST